MSETIAAVFDGHVFRPEEPVGLKPNTRVRITIEDVKPEEDGVVSFLRAALNLDLQGPPDWSETIEEYLYRPERPDED